MIQKIVRMIIVGNLFFRTNYSLFSCVYHNITMAEWHKKEFLNQGTEELRSVIQNELKIDNKSILNDFTNHVTVIGGTFFNQCWSTRIVFSRLLEREYQKTYPRYTHILPHPLFLLLLDIRESDTYILAPTTPNFVIQCLK